MRSNFKMIEQHWDDINYFEITYNDYRPSAQYVMQDGTTHRINTSDVDWLHNYGFLRAETQTTSSCFTYKLSNRFYEKYYEIIMRTKKYRDFCLTESLQRVVI